MPRVNLIAGRPSSTDGNPQTQLAAFFANRRDARVLRRLVAQFDELTHADWEEADALAEVLTSADRLNASESVRAALSELRS